MRSHSLSAPSRIDTLDEVFLGTLQKPVEEIKSYTVSFRITSKQHIHAITRKSYNNDI
jgi:hypothetical protein